MKQASKSGGIAWVPREIFFKVLSPGRSFWGGAQYYRGQADGGGGYRCIKWNVELISSIFPEETGLILSIPLSYFKPTETIIWVAEKNGMFSTKKCFFLARSCGEICGDESTGSVMNSETQFIWKALWRACVPRKVKICVWRGCMNALPTRANLKRRKVITTETCFFCDGDTETVEHELLECPGREGLSREVFKFDWHR